MQPQPARPNRALTLRSRRWVSLLLASLAAACVLLGGATPVGAQEEEQEGEAPWADYDPGPSPRAADGELYHGRGESSSAWEEDDGCEHRYYSWGTPYWDCHARGMSGDNGVGDECEEEAFFYLTDEGRFVGVEGEGDDHEPPFVVCADPNGPYTGDDFRLYVPPDDYEGDSVEAGGSCVAGSSTCTRHPDVKHDGTRYRVCTYRPSWQKYGTDWMHCPTYGFRTVPCVETQGLGINIGGFQIGDENQGFWEGALDGFSDQFEARIVPDVVGPVGGAPTELGAQLGEARALYGDDLSWWYEEIIAESASEQGKGCTLAETPPTYRTCEEINDDRDHSQAVLDSMDDSSSPDDDVMTGTRVMQAQERAYHEEQVRDLESQGGVIPDTCFGTFPTDAYRVLYDSGSAFNVTEWTGQLMASLGELAFGLLKQAVAAALWAVRAALTLDVTQYREMVANLSDRWDVEILNLGGDQDLSVMDMAWFTVFATAGFLALRGKAGRGGGEIVSSIVMAAIGSVLMTGAFTPNGYFDSALGLVDSASRGMLLAGSGCDANDELSNGDVERLIAGRYEPCDDDGADDEPDGLGGTIHYEFVERPFRYINWGTDDLSETCVDAERRLLRLTGTPSDYATRFMEREGCIDEANHSGQMTTGRLMSVLVVTVLGLFVSVILLSIAVTLLLSKFVIAILFGFLPFFVAAAILPGKGRRPAIWALENMVKAWIVAALMGAVLGGALVGLQEIAKVTEGRSMIERQSVLGILLFVLWMLYKQADKGGQTIASAGGKKAGEVFSPSAHWAGEAAGGGGAGGGIRLNGVARGLSASGISQAATIATAAGAVGTAAMTAAGGAGRVAGAPFRGLGKSVVTRNAERRTANRSIANLVRKDILAGNLRVGTPTRTRGLKRGVRSALRQHGPGHVLPDPKKSSPDGASSAATSPKLRGDGDGVTHPSDRVFRTSDGRVNLAHPDRPRSEPYPRRTPRRFERARQIQSDSRTVARAVRRRQRIDGPVRDAAQRLGVGRSRIEAWNVADRNNPVARRDFLRHLDERTRATELSPRGPRRYERAAQVRRDYHDVAGAVRSGERIEGPHMTSAAMRLGMDRDHITNWNNASSANRADRDHQREFLVPAEQARGLRVSSRGRGGPPPPASSPPRSTTPPPPSHPPTPPPPSHPPIPPPPTTPPPPSHPPTPPPPTTPPRPPHPPTPPTPPPSPTQMAREARQVEFTQWRADLERRLERGEPIPPRLLNNLGIFSPEATAWNNQFDARTLDEARHRLADFPGDRLTGEQLSQAADRIRGSADANIAAAREGHQRWLASQPGLDGTSGRGTGQAREDRSDRSE